MNLMEYVPLALRTEKQLPTGQRMEHACLGLITEAGEIVTIAKRVAIYNKQFDDGMRAHMLEEIGDIMWYFAVLADVICADLEKFQNLHMPESDNDGNKLTSLAMVLGEHIGRICHGVIRCEMQGYLTNKDQLVISASMGMVLEICRIAAEHCNSTLEKCLEDNIVKLRIRYPDAYTNEAAEARADKAGVDARNS